MKKLKVPCWNDGKDCDKRQVGCRRNCKEWQEYEKQQEEYRKQQYIARKTEHSADRFLAERCNENSYKRRGK